MTTAPPEIRRPHESAHLQSKLDDAQATILMQTEMINGARRAASKMMCRITELETALKNSLDFMVAHLPKAAKGHAEGCMKYTAGGWDMWNCKCTICQARRAIASATGEEQP